MIPVTRNWLNAAAGALVPAQVLTIFSPNGTQLVQYSREVKNPNYGPVCANHWVAAMDGGGSKGDILSGNATNTELNIGVLDVGKAITTLLTNTTLEGLTATLTSGFAGLGGADFAPLGTYIVSQIKTDKSNLRYVFNLRDFGLKLQNLCYLTGDDGWPTSSSDPHTLWMEPMDLLTDVLQNQCGYPAANINSAAIAAYRASLFHGRTLKWELDQPTQGKALLQQELFSPLAGYGFWNYAGQFTPYFPLPTAAPAPAYPLTTRNIKSPIPTFDAGPFVAELVHMMDYDGQNYNTSVGGIYAPAITAYGLPDLTTKQSRGLHSANGGVLYALLAQQALFRRYAMKPRLLKLRCFWPVVQCEIGDLVSVTHALIPDKATGLGLNNHWFEITGKDIDWDKAEVSFDLLDVNWLNATPLQIAPNGTPAWASATLTQKATYGYVNEGQLVY
jgi:hypothetical protein